MCHDVSSPTVSHLANSVNTRRAVRAALKLVCNPACGTQGGQVQGILLWPLGGLAFIGHTAGPKADMWVAVAGPLTHAPMVAFWVSLVDIYLFDALVEVGM